MLIITFSILLNDKVAPADCICMDVHRWNIGHCSVATLTVAVMPVVPQQHEPLLTQGNKYHHFQLSW